MFDFVGKRRYGYIFSGILTILGLLFILATFIPNAGLGLQFSIAYTGGTVWEVHFEGDTPDPADGPRRPRGAWPRRLGRGHHRRPTSASTCSSARRRWRSWQPTVTEGSAAAAAASASPGLARRARLAGRPPRPTRRPAGRRDRRRPPSLAVPDASASSAPTPRAVPDASPGRRPRVAGGAGDGPVAGVPTEGQFGALATALQERFGRIDEVRQQNSVGAVVSAELIQQTFLLILFASLGIMAWISYRFRDVRMGVTAVVALIHDVIVVVGVFAILGTLIGLQIDALFVTAMLTVIGFSVHDTIVVFDRVRENRGALRG